MTGWLSASRQAARRRGEGAAIMTKKTKGRAGGHQATPKTSKRNRNSTGAGSCMKAAIVTLALWGWFPLALADRINRLGGPRDE